MYPDINKELKRTSDLGTGIATPQHNKYILLNSGTGHEHTVTLLDGVNGTSSQAAGHVHQIVDGKVQPAFGHTHNLGAWEGFGFGNPRASANSILALGVLIFLWLTLRI